MTQRSAPAPFLTKTYQLVDDERTNDVISWSESGETFVVWKQADFAKDLLPNYFKHNNFSSFVRQLNTYGFRKIVPDKWEFANEHFKRGRKELLSEIKRRKTLAQASGKSGSGGGGNSASNSGAGDDVGSISTSSTDSKNNNVVTAETKTAPPPEYAELSGENEKLKKDNEMLSWELAEAKKQCEELVSFLKEYVKVGPDQINRIIMRQGTTSGSSREEEEEGGGEEDEAKVVGEEGGESLKLFGVWLMRGSEKETTKLKEEKIRTNNNHHHHNNNNNKRVGEDQIAFSGPHPSKQLKASNTSVHFGASPVNVMIN